MDQQAFLGHLSQSGLLSQTQLDEVDRRCGTGAPLHEVTEDLLAQGWLTPFQYKRISSGKAKGLVLGQYRIVDELGRGGFGCVYKAIHGLMNRVVALKVISPALVEDSQARSWFRREVLAATQLCHPNIVMAYDANEVDDVLFLAMEYVDGLNLDQLVRQQGPLPIGLACNMLHQAGRALQYAHDQGMVHRDIKPANLLIPNNAPTPSDPDIAFLRGVPSAASVPLVKVVDFGLARLCGKASTNTIHLRNDKGFVGTPSFISPEQARNIHDVDIRSDLYSLGCTFYFALAGRAPFQGKSPLEIVVQHLEKEAPPLQSLRPEIPAALASIVRRLMAKKPEKRFATPADLVAELSFLCGSLPAAAPLQMPPLPGATEAAPSLSRPANWHEDSGALEEQQLPVTIVSDKMEIAPPQSRHEEPTNTQVLQDNESSVMPRSQAVSHFAVALDGPSGEPIPPDVDASLHVQWNQWLAIIEAVSQGRDPATSEAAYRNVHSQLLKAIQAKAQDAGCDTVSDRGTTARPGPNAALWQHLENLVAPWLTLHSLAAVDADTASSLCQRCGALGIQLGLARRRWQGWKWLGFAAAFLVAIGLGLLFVLNPGVAPGNTRTAWVTVWRFLQSSPLLVAVPFVALAGWYFLPRFFRA